jgi:hypothetical protein
VYHLGKASNSCNLRKPQHFSTLLQQLLKFCQPSYHPVYHLGKPCNSCNLRKLQHFAATLAGILANFYSSYVPSQQGWQVLQLAQTATICHLSCYFRNNVAISATLLQHWRYTPSPTHVLSTSCKYCCNCCGSPAT